MPRNRRPRVTRAILEGLTQAHGRMEADDISDLPDDKMANLEAAGEWLSAMWQFFPDERRPGEAEAAEAQRRAAGLPPIDTAD